VRTVSCTVLWWYICTDQGDHSPGKPGKVREFQSGQGKVRENGKSQQKVRGSEIRHVFFRL